MSLGENRLCSQIVCCTCFHLHCIRHNSFYGINSRKEKMTTDPLNIRLTNLYDNDFSREFVNRFRKDITWFSTFVP